MVNYNQDEFWKTMFAVDNNERLESEARTRARQYSIMASEDESWNYVLPLIESRGIELAVPTPSPIDTTMVSPEEADALQERIDAALAYMAQLEDGLDAHDGNDTDQNENEDLIIANIIGGIVLVLLVAAHSYKYVSGRTIHSMMRMSNSMAMHPSSTPGAKSFVNTSSVSNVSSTGGGRRVSLKDMKSPNVSATYSESIGSVSKIQGPGGRALDDL